MLQFSLSVKSSDELQNNQMDAYYQTYLFTMQTKPIFMPKVVKNPHSSSWKWKFFILCLNEQFFEQIVSESVIFNEAFPNRKFRTEQKI